MISALFFYMNNCMSLTKKTHRNFHNMNSNGKCKGIKNIHSFQ